MNQVHSLVFRRYVLLALRILLGVIFIYASIHKLHDPVAFSRIIYGYKILPPWAINLVAIILPGIELVAGCFLLLGFWIRGASLVIAVSLLIFSLAIGFNLYRGLEFDCGCFSFSESPHGAAADLLVRDLLLLAGAVTLLFSRRHFCALENILGRNK